MSNKATYFWHDEFLSKQDFQKLAAEQLIESRAIEFSGHTVILTLKLLEIHCKNNVIVMMITSIITIAGLLSNSWKYQLIKRRCPVLTSYWLEPYLLRQSSSLRKQPTFRGRRHHRFPPWGQKFHTDDLSLSISEQCFWLAENLFHPIRLQGNQWWSQ